MKTVPLQDTMPSIALITGASQGVGKATARLLAANGYDLALAARQRDRLEAVAEEIRATGRQVVAVSTDVGDAAQVQELVDKATAQLGPIDVLINNAGICMSGGVEHATLEDWHHILDTNLWGYLHTVHALLPQMLERGQGTIVNVGSIGSKMPLPLMTPYCTSKYAIAGFTDCLRAELSPKGIHVAGIYPGVIKTSFMERSRFRGATEAEVQKRREQMQQAIDSSFASQPEEVAEAIWKAVRHQQSEVSVGPAGIITRLYQLFPWISRGMMAQATKVA